MSRVTFPHLGTLSITAEHFFRALGLDALGVELVGDIPAGLSALSLPNLSLVGDLWPGAVGIALMAFVESFASARAFADRNDPLVITDQELLALGAANVGGSFFQAYPAGGGTSQTAVNDQAGARSQLAEAVTDGAVILMLLFLAPLPSLMPEATLGALVLLAAEGLIHGGEFRATRRSMIWGASQAPKYFARCKTIPTMRPFLGCCWYAQKVGSTSPIRRACERRRRLSSSRHNHKSSWSIAVPFPTSSTRR
jgi:hypothetical protein